MPLRLYYTALAMLPKHPAAVNQGIRVALQWSTDLPDTPIYHYPDCGSLILSNSTGWMFPIHPSDSVSAVTRLPGAKTLEMAQCVNYRCPVCGRIVDATSAEEILLHHEHVTHPRDFLLAKSLVA
jgi:hypothetical protein